MSIFILKDYGIIITVIITAERGQNVSSAYTVSDTAIYRVSARAAVTKYRRLVA